MLNPNLAQKLKEGFVGTLFKKTTKGIFGHMHLFSNFGQLNLRMKVLYNVIKYAL